jgi:hypothetical protein
MSEQSKTAKKIPEAENPKDKVIQAFRDGDRGEIVEKMLEYKKTWFSQEKPEPQGIVDYAKTLFT